MTARTTTVKGTETFTFSYAGGWRFVRNNKPLVYETDTTRVSDGRIQGLTVINEITVTDQAITVLQTMKIDKDVNPPDPTTTVESEIVINRITGSYVEKSKTRQDKDNGSWQQSTRKVAGSCVAGQRKF